jgi:hypothetical protein
MLNQFKHGLKTDLTNGIINNQDACLIALYHLVGGRYGIATSRDLKDSLRNWRPGLQFTYLFNTSAHGGYGFVGHSVSHAANRVPNYMGGSSFLRKTFWYRVTKGQYAITNEGMYRLKALGIVK